MLLFFASTGLLAQNLNSDPEQQLLYAEKLFAQKKFNEAYPLYSSLLSLDRKNPLLSYRFGVCMLFSDRRDCDKPIKYLEAANGKINGNDALMLDFYLGIAYHQAYRFKEAFDLFKSFELNASRQNEYLSECILRKRMCADGYTLLQHINDIYVLDKHEVSIDNFFRSYDLSNFGGSIVPKPNYLKTKQDKKNKDLQLIFLTSDKNVIYFSSLGKDKSKKDKDIYKAVKNNAGEWSEPQLVSKNINTDFDEDYPFVLPDGKTMYFCSKGHNSIGGYDIFRSVFNDKLNDWSKPVNINFAINTPFDDILFITDLNQQYAWFSSFRNSNDGRIMVFKVKIDKQILSIDDSTISNINIDQIQVNSPEYISNIYDLRAKAALDVNYYEKENPASFVFDAEDNQKYNIPVNPTDSDIINITFAKITDIKRDVDVFKNQRDAFIHISAEKKYLADSDCLKYENLLKKADAETDANAKNKLIADADNAKKSCSSSNEVFQIATEMYNQYDKAVGIQSLALDRALEKAGKIQVLAASQKLDTSVILLKKLIDEIENLKVNISQTRNEIVGNSDFIDFTQNQILEQKLLLSQNAESIKKIEIEVASYSKLLKRTSDKNLKLDYEDELDALNSEIIKIKEYSSKIESEIAEKELFVKSLKEKSQARDLVVNEAFLYNINNSTIASNSSANAVANIEKTESNESVKPMLAANNQLKETDNYSIDAAIDVEKAEKNEPIEPMLVLGDQLEGADDDSSEVDIEKTESNESVKPMLAANNQLEETDNTAIDVEKAEKNESIEPMLVSGDQLKGADGNSSEVDIENVESNESVKPMLAANNQLKETDNQSIDAAIDAKKAEINELIESTLALGNHLEESDNQSVDTAINIEKAEDDELIESILALGNHLEESDNHGIDAAINVEKAEGDESIEPTVALDNHLEESDNQGINTAVNVKKAESNDLIASTLASDDHLEKIDNQSVDTTVNVEKTESNKSIEPTLIAGNQLEEIDNQNVGDNGLNSYSKIISEKIEHKFDSLTSLNLKMQNEVGAIAYIYVQKSNERSKIMNNFLQAKASYEIDSKPENLKKFNIATTALSDIDLQLDILRGIYLDYQKVVFVNSQKIEDVDKAFSDVSAASEVDTVFYSSCMKKYEDIVSESIDTSLYSVINLKIFEVRSKIDDYTEILAADNEKFDADIADINTATIKLSKTKNKSKRESIIAHIDALEQDKSDVELKIDSIQNSVYNLQDTLMVLEQKRTYYNDFISMIQSKSTSEIGDMAAVWNMSSKVYKSDIEKSFSFQSEILDNKFEKSQIFFEHSLIVDNVYKPSYDSISISHKGVEAHFLRKTNSELNEVVDKEDPIEENDEVIIENKNLNIVEDSIFNDDYISQNQENNIDFEQNIVGIEDISRKLQVDTVKNADDSKNNENIIVGDLQKNIDVSNNVDFLQNINSEIDSTTSIKQKVDKNENVSESLNVEVSEKENLAQGAFIEVTDNQDSKKSNGLDTLFTGLCYKIQISASKTILDTNRFFTNLNGITYDHYGSWYQYMTGFFNKFADANVNLFRIRNMGYNDAFVVAYYNGKRISILEARKLEKTNLEDPKNSSIIANKQDKSDNVAQVETILQKQTQNKETQTKTEITKLSELTDLVYSVQLGVYATPRTSERLFGITDLIEDRMPNSYYRYFSGIFSDYQKAWDYCKSVCRKYISDAFVVVFHNGKKISLNEARKLESAGAKTDVLSQPELRTVDVVQNVKSAENTDSLRREKMAAKPIFKIQIGAYRKDVPIDIVNALLDFSNFGVEKLVENDVTIYTVGNYPSYNEALKVKNDIVKYVPDAFVVAFSKGKKISVKDAEKLLYD